MAEDLGLKGFDDEIEIEECKDSSLLFFFLILVVLFDNSWRLNDGVDSSLLFFFLLLVILLGGGCWF